MRRTLLLLLADGIATLVVAGIAYSTTGSWVPATFVIVTSVILGKWYLASKVPFMAFVSIGSVVPALRVGGSRPACLSESARTVLAR